MSNAPEQLYSGRRLQGSLGAKNPDRTGRICYPSWIPPPITEEMTNAGGASSRPIMGPSVDDEHNSSSDDDIDKDLIKRLEELAIRSRENGDYAKAESFYRKLIDRRGASSSSLQEIVPLRIKLAETCLYQQKWAEADNIISPIALERKVADTSVYMQLHALALAYLKSELRDAERCCMRALWGKRKLYGKKNYWYWDTLALLAAICDARGDPVEAEVHRSFIPSTCGVTVDDDALLYLDRYMNEMAERE